VSGLTSACGATLNGAFTVTATAATSFTAASSLTCTGSGDSGTATTTGPTFTYSSTTGIATFDLSQVPLLSITNSPTNYTYTATANITSGTPATPATSPTTVIVPISGTSTTPYYIVNVYTDSGAGTTCNNQNVASPAGGNNCDLRDAIAALNTTSTGGTIIFSNNGTTTQQVITLASNLTGVSHSATITGPGPAYLTISGAGKYTIFNDGATNLNLSGMTIANAYSNAQNGPAVTYTGIGSLTINNDVFIGNQAGSSASTSYNGGAIYESGTGIMNINNSSFINNSATSTLNVNIIGETVVSCNGGNYCVQFTTTGPTGYAVGTAPAAGAASTTAPYIYGLSTASGGCGGTYFGQSGSSGSQGYYITAVSTTAPYSFTVEYAVIVGTPTFTSTPTVQTCSSTITEDGFATISGFGGAIATSSTTSSATGASSDVKVNINNSTFIGNTAFEGGALYLVSGAGFSEATVSNSTFYNNTSIKYGSAIATTVPVQVTNSTIVGNTAYFATDYNAAVTGISTSNLITEGNVSLYNSVVADNTSPKAADLGYTVNDSAYNTFTYGSTNVIGSFDTTPSSYASLSSLGLTVPGYYGGSIYSDGSTTTDVSVTAESASGSAVTFTTSTNSYIAGEVVYVTGLTTACGLTLTNRSYTVASSPAPTSTSFAAASTAASCTGSSDTGLAYSTALHTMAIQPGSVLLGKGTTSPISATITGVGTTNTIPVTQVAQAGTIAAFTNTGTNGLSGGQTVYLSGFTSTYGATFNDKYWVVASSPAPTSTSFSITFTSTAGTSSETTATADPTVNFTVNTMPTAFTAGQIVYVTGLGTATCDGYFNNKYYQVLASPAPTTTSFSGTAATSTTATTTSTLCPVITAVSTSGPSAYTVTFTTNVATGFAVGASVYVSGLTSTCSTTTNSFNNKTFVVTSVVTGSPYSFTAAAGNTNASCSGTETGATATTGETGTASWGTPTTDERAFVRDPASGDIGALASNLAMTVGSVATQNVGVIFTPSPTATVTESGYGESGISVYASLSYGTLMGTDVVTTNSSGVATFSSLVSDTAEASTKLIVDAGPDTLTGSSASFIIQAGAVTQLIFGTKPAATVVAGGNAGSAITVQEEDQYGNVTGTDLITLTVTGPAGFSGGPYTATAVAGVATFNLSSDVLSIVGSYSYTASESSISSSAALETVTIGSMYGFNVSVPASTVGVASTVTVTAVDAYGNTETGFSSTNAVTLSSSTDSTASFSSPADLTSGTGTFTATFDKIGTAQTVTAAAASGGYTGTSTSAIVYDPIWLVNGNGTVVKISAAGSSLTGGAVGTSGSTSTTGGVAFDSSGNVWSVSSANNTLDFVSKAGASSASYSGGGLSTPVAVAVDGSGYIWIANSGNGSVSVFNNSGTAQSSSSGYGASGSTALGAGPSAIAIDNSGGVWVTSSTGNTVTHIIGAATPVTTPTATAVANGTVGVAP